jgi:outer membrane protein assembly factor BamA
MYLIKKIPVLFFLYSLLLSEVSFGQVTAVDTLQPLIVSKINLLGNRRTKDYIILREMRLKAGDTLTYAALQQKIKESKALVYNTNMFTTVEMDYAAEDATHVQINVMLLERWYIYPIPQFAWIDRNFNEWYNTYNADFTRTYYGIKFSHFNLTGRSDQLNFTVLNGFSRSLLLHYNLPLSNRKMTTGFSFGAGFNETKLFPYKTDSSNRLLQYRGSNYDKSTFNIYGTYRIRKGFYDRHAITFQYNSIQIIDSILTPKYNPGYLNANNNSVEYPDLMYSWQHVNVDNINYPLHGVIWSALLHKRGWGWKGGMNMLSFEGNYNRYLLLPANLYLRLQGTAKIRMPFQLSYINRRMMGYGDFYLRGLEYYVVDGAAAGITKVTFAKKLIAFRIPVPFRIKQLPFIPFSFYAKTYGDAGYCHTLPEYAARLNNRMLYTTGAGLDLLSIYDSRLSIEYSLNQLGEKGLFLHARSSF